MEIDGARDSSIQVFVHIPKTAGSTLTQVIERQFRQDEILSYEDCHWAINIRDLPDRAAAGLKGIRCVMGHTPFGMHEAVDREVKYVTMLRDPVEFTLSYFSYARERISHVKEQRGNLPNDPRMPQLAFFADVPRMSLDDWVKFMDDTGMANLQTRYVSGHLDLRNPLPPFDRLPETAIDLARTNLFSARTTFGIVEHFDLSLLLFKKRLGWRNIYYRRENVTRVRLARPQVPARSLERIHELHAVDLQLYKVAMDGFWRALEQYGLDRAYVLYRFRTANRVHGLLRDGMGLARRLGRGAVHAVGLPRADA